MGRSRTVSYSFTATARAVVSAGKSRFACSMGSPTPLRRRRSRVGLFPALEFPLNATECGGCADYRVYRLG